MATHFTTPPDLASQPLIDQVFAICQKLADKGWPDFLRNAACLDITLAPAAKLAVELARLLVPDPAKRSDCFKEFPDFAFEGMRAIEPGRPSYSLLFHAFASPLVGDGKVSAYPTPEDLDIIENYIYSLNKPTIAQLRERAGNAPLALVVYAAEYRPAIQTVHGKHADMCFSRTGVARIGTAKEQYIGAARGYDCLDSKDRHAVHVVPCRYSAYIAAQMKGDGDSFGPLRPREGGTVDIGGNPVTPDKKRNFWVPIHKIFSGDECIDGLDLKLGFKHYHHNEKLRRFHLFLEGRGLPTEHCGDELTQFPFIIPEAYLAAVKWVVPGTSIRVIPTPHDHMIEEAYYAGKRLAFTVPAGSSNTGAFNVPPRPGGGRRAPEYVYVRKEVLANGQLDDLNKYPDVGRKINLGHYRAQLYLDYVGDGWIKAYCPELGTQIPQSLPAYSILAPPDFLPAVKQQDVQDWWLQSAPPEIRATIFPDFLGTIPTEPLSDARIAPNITFRQRINPMQDEPVFDSTDDSYTAVVAPPGSGKDALTKVRLFDDRRVSPLPDGAAGLFAPGWDVSMDQNDDENSKNGTLHMAGYSGSLPFAEDARICAALSAFWPAVAPDDARLYQPGSFPSVSPIPDRLLGWDELKQPGIIRCRSRGTPGIVRFYTPAYTDYVETALKNAFDFSLLGQVKAKKYERWTLLMARVYQALDLKTTADKARWAVVRFRKVDVRAGDAQLAAAERATGLTLSEPYRFYLILPICIEHQRDPRFVHAVFERRVLAFAMPEKVLFWDTNNAGWVRREF